MSSPIRVAHVMGKMVGGGLEAVVMNYYRHIDRDRVQFDLLVDEDSTLVPCEEVESLGGRIITVPPYQQLSRYIRELERLFCSQRWPIVHSHISTLSVFPLRAAKRAGVPVRIAHGHNTAGKGEIAKNAMKHFLRPFANVYPTNRLACSEFVGDWLFGKNHEFLVLKNALDLDVFRYDSDDRGKIRNELLLPDGAFTVGHVSRFAPEKNHRFILESFAKLIDLRSDSRLVLVGDGKTKSEIELYARELGLTDRVVFLGQREDTDRLYRAFDVLVMPSLREGLGLAAVEAQCSGLPCLLSDAITREVNVSGTVEFLPIGDPEVWACHLLNIAEHPASEPRRLAAVNLLKEYDIREASPKLASYYEGLVADLPHDSDRGCLR